MGVESRKGSPALMELLDPIGNGAPDFAPYFRFESAKPDTVARSSAYRRPIPSNAAIHMRSWKEGRPLSLRSSYKKHTLPSLRTKHPLPKHTPKLTIPEGHAGTSDKTLFAACGNRWRLPGVNEMNFGATKLSPLPDRGTSVGSVSADRPHPYAACAPSESGNPPFRGWPRRCEGRRGRLCHRRRATPQLPTSRVHVLPPASPMNDVWWKTVIGCGNCNCK